MKKIINILALMALFLACPDKAMADIIVYQGDMNKDCVYSIGDLAQVIDIINNPSDNVPEEADVNGDGTVDLNDVTMLANFILCKVVPGSRGKAARTDGSYVEWMQLWPAGPRFALCNVGANSETEAGGHYKWGATVEGSSGTASSCTSDIQGGTDDTAKQLWGNDWTMPSYKQILALTENCTYTRVSSYNGSAMWGGIFQGKDLYASNQIFLRASGDMYGDHPSYGMYWTSSTNSAGSPFAIQLTYNISWPVGGAAIGLSVRPIVCEEDDNTFIVHPGEEANPEVGAGVKGQNF